MFGNIGQGAVALYVKATIITTTFTCKLIFRQIIIMRYLKIGKQMGINMIQASQGTETFGVIFMFSIIHATKVHIYTIYNKSNLY